MAKLDPTQSTVSETQPTEQEPVNPTPDNTEVSDTAKKESEAKSQDSQEPTTEVSQREANRVQTLANAKAEAERLAQAAEIRAQQAEEMLRRVVQQPVVSQETQIAQQYSSFDKNIGYPTDPREYAQFVEQRAQARAETAGRESARRENDQIGMNQMLSDNPGIQDDPILMAAIVAQKAKNPNISYPDAARQAKKDLDERTSKEVTSRVTNDNLDKDKAYVETTRGASTNRQAESTPSPEAMSLEEKEAYLKKIGEWDK